MTIEKLEAYKALAATVEAIETEIATLYNPISSPNGRETIGAPGSGTSDPTAQSAMRIIALKEKLSEERENMYAVIEEIEDWLLNCPDPEIVSIVRWHYLLGLNWKQTTMKIYGYPDYQYCRKKIMRFFGREK